ncbi:hypothetical protein [Helicobacter canis]|uniref:hypothetical protein n=1 Tax=Helicobacter canis TaxID=29419 RepID=UPI0015F0DF72|nr:hypothetical protein [Helicobacter canis]
MDCHAVQAPLAMTGQWLIKLTNDEGYFACGSIRQEKMAFVKKWILGIKQEW